MKTSTMMKVLAAAAFIMTMAMPLPLKAAVSVKLVEIGAGKTIIKKAKKDKEPCIKKNSKVSVIAV